MVKVSSSKEKIKCPKCGKKMKMKKLEPVWDPSAVKPDGRIIIPDGKWV
jgi:hypothetical protein